MEEPIPATRMWIKWIGFDWAMWAVHSIHQGASWAIAGQEIGKKTPLVFFALRYIWQTLIAYQSASNKTGAAGIKSMILNDARAKKKKKGVFQATWSEN